MDKPIEKSWTQKNKRKFWIILIVCIPLLFFWFYSVFNTKTIRVNKDEISFFTVYQGAFEEYINISGVVLPKRTIQLVALEGGIIEKINIADGDFIEPGMEILLLSNQSLQLELINRETAMLDQLNNLRVSRMAIDRNYSMSYQNYLENELDMFKIKRKYELNKNLIEDDYVSKNEYQESLESYNSAVKKMAISKKTLKNDSLFRLSQIDQLNFSMKLIEDNLILVKNTMNNLSIASKYAGQISNFNCELGQNISKGEKIGEVDVKSGYIIRITVDEHYISRIHKGLKGKFELDNKTYLLDVKKIYPKVKDGVFEVDLGAEESLFSRIKLGQTLYVKLSLGEAKRNLLLSKGPHYQTTGGNWVYVVNKNGYAERRKVVLGKQNPKYYEIISGLKAGDIVITSNYTMFGDAELVEFEKK